MNAFRIVISAILAISCGTGAMGQVAQPAASPISRASFIATMDAEYKKLDSNNDGIVTRAEIDASQQRVAAAQAAQRAQAIFSQVDSDHNGQLSLAEFTRATTGAAPKVDVSQMMARLDTNRDQKVTLVEYRTITLTGFDKLDTDKDGVVSVAEQRAGGLVK